MVTPDQIQLWIEQGLPEAKVKVTGDGHHFEAVVVSAAFRNKNMLEQHRIVYGVLGDKMKQAIHALSLQTLTPEQITSE